MPGAVKIQGRYGSNENDLATARIDASTEALETIEYTHHEIHGGSHYTATYGVADIGAATTPDDAITLTFTTPNTTKWAHMLILFECVGGALCRLREGGSGGGSPTGAITCFNNNRNSSNTSGLLSIAGTPVAGEISYDAGLDTGGNLLIDEYISGATTNQGRAGGGAEAGARHEWVLKQNTRYQLSIVSTANVAASLIIHWYEHTDKN
jgi:hypothetical protein